MRLIPLLAGALLIGIGSTAATESGAPSSPSSVNAAALFAYDRAAPLAVHELGVEKRDGAVIHDVTFNGAKGPVKAFIVTPDSNHAAFAGVLYAHWLGEPETTNRQEFLNEAVALTGENMVSVLIDAMWATPQWYRIRVPEEDYAHSLEQVITLRRAMDLLLAQPGVDPKRVAFVGHDFGAMYGSLFGAVDQRAVTYVFMAGTPHFADWYLFAQKPKAIDDYRRQMATIDPVAFIGKLSPMPVFFQFAAHDEYVSAEAAAAFFAAAGPRKQMAVYDANHSLKNSDATADRVTWLIRMLSVRK